jgi:predicted TIM-barrel fold metal-dependent hydrolase
VSVLTAGGLEQITQNPNPTLNGVLPGTPAKGLYYDTALSPAPSTWRSVLEITDIDHIVFGSDWPFAELLFLTHGDPQPQLSLSFPEAQRHAFERANALRLLPSLAARLA